MLSTCALGVALRTSARSLSKRLAALSTRCEEIAAEQDEIRQQLLEELKRERVRTNMARLRANRKATAQDEPAASSNGSAGRAQTEAEKDEWQRSMNLKLLTGEVKAPGRR